MKRLLLAFCLLIAAFPAVARAPRILFDLPYTVDNGYYVVWLDTPVGPRRFLFDTGFSESAVSESLCGELRAQAEESRTITDFEGYKASVERVRLDSLRMGPLVFRDKTLTVLPDSSSLLHCFGFDGVVGSDLLQGLAVRFPNANSTISVTNDVRAFGKLDHKRSCPIYKSMVCPFIRVTLGAGDRKHRVWALFDTGSKGYFTINGEQMRRMRGVAADLFRTEGYPSSFGVTGHVQRREIVRGRIPTFTVAGTAIADMPFQVTSGREVIGGALLEWGQVIVDYRGRRFYFLPREGVELRVERQPVRNIMPMYVDGQLVVGYVWDEALRDVAAPGDRIIRIGDDPAENFDLCRFLRGEVRGDGKTLLIERKDGSRVMVPVEDM